tara:strand:- start:271 stop:597 length:327 start_codon:yes stop_codon:yes gene_type:complete
MSTEPTQYEKWDRGKTLMLESLHKPDDRLRGCAHNQKCYHELIEIREQVIEMVQKMSNPRPFIDERAQIPTLTENTIPVESYVESKEYSYAADITLTDIARFQRGNLL